MFIGWEDIEWGRGSLVVCSMDGRILDGGGVSLVVFSVRLVVCAFLCVFFYKTIEI